MFWQERGLWNKRKELTFNPGPCHTEVLLAEAGVTQRGHRVCQPSAGSLHAAWGLGPSVRHGFRNLKPVLLHPKGHEGHSCSLCYCNGLYAPWRQKLCSLLGSPWLIVTRNNWVLIRWAWQELRKPWSVCFHLKSWVIDTISVCSPLASGSLVSPATQPPAPRKQSAPEPMLTLAAWVSSLLSVVSFWIPRTSCTYLYQHIHFKWVTTCSWKESKNSVGTENILYLCIASYWGNAEYSCWSLQQPWRKKLVRILILVGQVIVWRLRRPGNMCQSHQVDEHGSQDNGKGVKNSKKKV